MADIFNDAFESGDFTAWTANTSAVVATGVSGMEGVYCADLSENQSKLSKTLASPVNEIFVAFDFMPINEAFAYGNVLAFKLGADLLVNLYANGSGDTPIEVTLAGWSEVPGYYTLEEDTTILSAGTKYRIQVRFKPDPTNGIFQVKIDGVLVIDYTGPTTVSATTLDTFIVGAKSNDAMFFYADQVALDDAAWIDPELPSTDEFAADGFMALCGAGVAGGDENATTTDYVADGCMKIAGESVLDSNLKTEFAASGFYVLRGTGSVNSRIPAVYQAAGYIELSGICRMTSTVPYVPPTSLTTEYEAGGSIALLGPCSMASVLRQVEAYMAGGWYWLGGKCALGIIMPSSLRVDAYAAAGCYELLAPCSAVRGSIHAYAADTQTGPCLEITSRARVGFIFPQITEMVAEGGYVLESPEFPDEGIFETLVLTGGQNGISIYSNFNFNSYAKYGGRYYGASKDGIFLLEGEDDAGVPIHSGARIGPANFGSDREKRLRLIRCGGDCDQAQVRVSDGNGKSGQFPVEGGRAKISRAVQGRELTVEIVDFKSLNHLEIVPLVLAKR